MHANTKEPNATSYNSYDKNMNPYANNSIPSANITTPYSNTWTEGNECDNIVTESVVQNISLGEIYVLLALHTLLLMLITWFTEAVFPGKYGVAEKPWFFLTVGAVLLLYVTSKIDQM